MIQRINDLSNRIHPIIEPLRAETGGKGIRTPDFQLAKLALYQLSYAPGLRLAECRLPICDFKQKKMPDVDLAIVIRHCRCAAAKTELCVTVSFL